MARDAEDDAAVSNTCPLDKKDIRLIRKCCTYPQAGSVAFSVLPVLALLWFFGEIIDELAFHYLDGFYYMGYVLLGFTFVYSAIALYFIIVSKYAVVGERWEALEERMGAQQPASDHTAEAAGVAGALTAGTILRDSDSDAAKTAGGVATVAGALEGVAMVRAQMKEIDDAADAVAKAYGVALPDIKRLLIVMFAIPVVVMVAAYGVKYGYAVHVMHQSQAAAAEQVERISSAFETAGLVARDTDPLRSYDYDGYTVFGDMPRNRYQTFIRDVDVHLDRNGLVNYVFYREEIDLEKSLEENLAQAQADFDVLGEALEASGAQTEVPELTARLTLSEEFRRQFLAGDIHTDITVRESDEEDSYLVSYIFKTSEWTSPYIEMFIQAL